MSKTIKLTRSKLSKCERVAVIDLLYRQSSDEGTAGEKKKERPETLSLAAAEWVCTSSSAVSAASFCFPLSRTKDKQTNERLEVRNPTLSTRALLVLPLARLQRGLTWIAERTRRILTSISLEI